MKGFVTAKGFDKVIEQINFPKNTPKTMWGVFDEYIFNYAESIMDTINAPTLITIFTTTNHQPWILPENKTVFLQFLLNYACTYDVKMHFFCVCFFFASKSQR